MKYKETVYEQVLDLYPEGLSAKEIAEEIGSSLAVPEVSEWEEEFDKTWPEGLEQPQSYKDQTDKMKSFIRRVREQSLEEAAHKISSLRGNSNRHGALYEEKYDGIEDYCDGWDDSNIKSQTTIRALKK